MGGMLRLASYDKCGEFEELRGEISKIQNKHLDLVVKDLIENQSRFGFAGDVDDTIDYQVIPYLIQNAKISDEHFKTIDDFLNCYKQNVKHSLSKITAKKLGLEEPMDKEALEYLGKKHYIDKILVGMRTKEYVKKVLSY